MTDSLQPDAVTGASLESASGREISAPRFSAACWGWGLVEVGLILVLAGLLAGTIPPDVNEAHYLAKAKHYWDPTWCRGDFFLESADAHLVFYWTFGWLTRFLSLEAVAWTGRLLTWGLLAWAWQRLSWTLVPKRFYALLTAGLFLTLLDTAAMAGEWVVGGVEAKGFAYVLVFVALRSLVLGKWSQVWLLLGGASSFHVLVGGWSVVAALVAWALSGDRPAPLKFCAALGLGFLLSLPGLIPSAMLTWGTEGEVANQAARVYVYERLGHHLVFHRLPQYLALRHGILFLVWVVIAALLPSDPKLRRIRGFVYAAVAIAVAGILIDVVVRHQPTRAASLLRFYWFRLSDVALPMGVALCGGVLIGRVPERHARLSHAAVALILLFVTAHVADTAWHHQQDRRPRAVSQPAPGRLVSQRRRDLRFRLWRNVCQWIGENTPPDAVFLTPRYQQTFKWYASRAEAVNWKDVPQDAQGLVQWWRRMQDLHPRTSAGNTISVAQLDLKGLSDRYHFQYVLVDRARTLRRLPFPKVFPPDTEEVSLYEVYELRPPQDSP